MADPVVLQGNAICWMHLLFTYCVHGMPIQPYT
jgi:hypothetical protein